MKKRTLDDKNLFLQRLFAFAEEKGGISEVARRINKHPAIFYNLVSRDAKPSIETLEDIANSYPDFDMNYIVRGKRTIDFDTWSRLKEENEALRLDKNAYRTAIEKMGKFKAVILPKTGLRNIKLRDFIFPNRSQFGSQSFCR